MKIEEIDQNLKTETILQYEDLVFLNVRQKPFSIYGLYDPMKQGDFLRLPVEIAQSVNPGVAELCFHTAGGRVRFSTDSPYLAIRVKMRSITHFAHMPLTGTSGFDLYEHGEDGRDNYRGTFVPPVETLIHADEKGSADEFVTWEALREVKNDGRMHAYTIHFPLYNGVYSLEIGLKKGSEIEMGAAYRPLDPIVYYGSSITQGGCASRPGNAYQNMISARTNIDHINLGFSGNARGEDAMAEYIAQLPMSVFVMDYDHNAPTADHLLRTHERFYQILRQAQPELPIIMVTKPDAKNNEEDIVRRGIVYDTFRKAWSSGDRNVSFIDGYSLFDPDYHDISTVDGCHPNDLGFAGMARGIGREIDRILNERLW